MSKIQRTCHQIDPSNLPSRYTTLIRVLFPPSLSDIQKISMHSTDHQNRDYSQARMAGTNMSMNNTAFSIRWRTTLNSIFVLTGIPHKQYGPYKSNILVCVRQETSIESWIGRITNCREISHQGRKSRTPGKSHIHVKELINRVKMTRLEAQLRLKKIGRMMDNRLSRFHTAHVRSVRITVTASQYHPNRECRVELSLWCSEPYDYKYWTQNEFLLVSMRGWVDFTNLQTRKIPPNI